MMGAPASARHLPSKILVADDDEGNGLTLAALLEDKGFYVDVVCSFSEATTWRGSCSTEYVPVLLDHSPGDGLGGCEPPELVTKLSS